MVRVEKKKESIRMDTFHHHVTTQRDIYIRVVFVSHNIRRIFLPTRLEEDVSRAGRRKHDVAARLISRPISHSTPPPPRKREGRSPASDCRVSPSVVASNLDDRRGHPTGARACAPESTLAATLGWAAVILASRVYT